MHRLSACPIGIAIGTDCTSPVVEPVVESMDFDLPEEDAEYKFSVARGVPDLCVYKSNVFLLIFIMATTAGGDFFK